MNSLSNHFNLSVDFICNLSDIKNKVIYKSEIDIKKMGKRFKLIRKELNLTQEKLAQYFNTTHSAISAYENGKTIIPTIFLVEFAKLSKVSLDWFLGKSDDKRIK